MTAHQLRIDITFGVSLLASASAFAQPAETPQEFAAASVKPSAAGARGYGIQPLPGGLHIVNCTLKQLVSEAYRVYDFQVTGGPKWADSDRFDIEGKTAGGARTPESTLRLMLRALLADRFKLTVQSEKKELSVFSLEAAKSGIKFQASQDTGAAPLFRVFQRRQITAERAPLEYLTEALSQLLGRPVIDETGLTGIFDYKLEWTPDEFQTASAENAIQGEVNAPSLASALREQMGLQMNSKRSPTEIVSITGAEKPAAN